MICFGVYLSLPAIAGSSVKVCARAATVGVEGDGEAAGGVSGGGGASHRFSASLWIGLGLGVGNSGGDEPRTLCPWSPPPLYSTARQGPTSLAWAGRPRSGRGSRAQ